MTRDGSDPQTVRLSVRDYVTLAAAVVVTCAVFAGAYLRHDRMLERLGSGQQVQFERIEKVENAVDSLERVVWNNYNSNGEPNQ